MAWEDLSPEGRQAAQAEAMAARRDLARLHALVFGSGPGADLLRRWREQYVDQVLPDEASQSALVASNARRQFVRQIERLTAEGRETTA